MEARRRKSPGPRRSNRTGPPPATAEVGPAPRPGIPYEAEMRSLWPRPIPGRRFRRELLPRMGRLLVRGGTGGQAMGARQLTPYVVLLIGLLLAACSAAAVEQPPEPVQVETPLPDQPVDSSPSSTPVPATGGGPRPGAGSVGGGGVGVVGGFP